MPRVAAELGALDVKRLAHSSGKGNLMEPVGGVTGLYMQLTPTGAKSWILRMLIGGCRRESDWAGIPL